VGDFLHDISFEKGEQCRTAADQGEDDGHDVYTRLTAWKAAFIAKLAQLWKAGEALAWTQ